MKLFDYIKSLDEKGLDTYAKRCNTTPAYLSIHVLHARKEPRKLLREALANESEGSVCLSEVLDHFGMNTSSAA